MKVRKNILIVDDSEINRAISSSALSNQYGIIEAKNGKEALEILEAREEEILLVFLDLMMPEMNGMELLQIMREEGWVRKIPVIIASAEENQEVFWQALELGAIDCLKTPLDMSQVQYRVMFDVEVAEKERELALVGGDHVFQIQGIVREILNRLQRKHNDVYAITEKEKYLICQASVLHDIGKLSVPPQILHKPGRLTEDEYEVVKHHSVDGTNMLKHLPAVENEPFMRYAYQISRWHHERYDGKGYPDGLKGDSIPLAAQVVALADVYDALRSERVYKKAYSKEETIKMIKNGECGVFNPDLLDCLTE